MELRQLEHFVAVAEERNFTRAAQKLHIVQSGLSSSVRALERELGAPLFVRSTRAVSLTSEGNALLTEARRTLNAAAAARAAVAEVSGGLAGEIMIGIMQCHRPGLTAALAAFHAECPGVKIRLVQSGTQLLLDDLARGRLDIAFTCDVGARPGVAVTRLSDQSMVFACSADDPLGGRDQVRLADVLDRDFADYPPGWGSRTLLDTFLREHGLGRQVTFEVGDTGALLEIVEHGLAVAVLPPYVRREVQRRVRFVDVAAPAPTFPVGVAVPETGPSPAARRLLETVLRDARGDQPVAAGRAIG